MAETDSPPRFFKVFISHFSSDSMLIPISYYDHLPHILPKTAILQGTGGCLWKVSLKKKQEEEVYFEQGWSKFVEDNALKDGDFLTFVYDGDNVFEVSVYGHDSCKETRAFNEVEDVEEEESVSSLSKNKEKYREVVEDSDEEEVSDYSLDSEETETYTCSDTILRSKNKGKKKKEAVEISEEDKTDSDYNEAFDRLYVDEISDSESSYSLDYEEDTDTETYVKPKVKNAKEKVETLIKNPEAYLDNPNNVYFETSVKNRKYELLVHAQLVKDYCLKFQDYVLYIDPKGELEAKTAKWRDQRVCIKKWMKICERNRLKKNDRILCEILRKQDLVYAIKIHIIKEKILKCD
ncbi:unnamed protein product [Cochlearia groenlandica]